MSRTSEPPTPSALEHANCLARSVVDALSTEPSLEAVTINRAQQKISVATLGKTDEPRVTASITNRIQNAYEKGVSENCLLLEVKGDRRTCDAPLSETERQKITIQH